MPDIEILYRDAELVAMNKPSGLAVHRGWARAERYAMTELRDALGQWVYPVHRLDQGASGVLVFGLSSEAARELSRQFELREVEKRYVALVRGAPAEQQRIDHPLRPERGEAQPATTEVTRLEQLGRYGWVEARPLTGRLHQIRRHLKHVSCPIIGDVRYGKGEHNRLFRERYGLHRLALHAAELRLRSIAEGRPLTITATLPEELSRALKRLRGDLEAPDGVGERVTEPR
jgi:tRNA pseudouridine65 synthase